MNTIPAMEARILNTRLTKENKDLKLRVALDEIALKQASEDNDRLEEENELLKKKLERATIALNFVIDATFITPKNAEVVIECLKAIEEITQMKSEAGE